jgi:hypothetical protein
MTLTLEIPPDVQRELAREAEARGVAIPALAIHLLEEAVTRQGAPARRKSSVEQIREWIDSLAEYSDQIPAMPGKTFPREAMYSDHD